jgi:hypothetical protein
MSARDDAGTRNARARSAQREGKYGRAEQLRRNLTFVHLTGRLANLVYSIGITNTDFYAHQYRPLLTFLESPASGILIADEVGLGKTIEAGLIWTEYRARYDKRRAEANRARCRGKQRCARPDGAQSPVAIILLALHDRGAKTFGGHLKREIHSDMNQHSASANLGTPQRSARAWASACPTLRQSGNSTPFRAGGRQWRLSGCAPQLRSRGRATSVRRPAPRRPRAQAHRRRHRSNLR